MQNFLNRKVKRIKTCLVTGGAGFIGSHLCDYLIGEGYKVIAVDNLLTGLKNNIVHLLNNPSFEFIEADVTKNFEYPIDKIDYIFHLASPASPIDYQNFPEETLLTNSLGTLNMLNLAKNKNAKILITSTSEIYGDPKEHPQKETYFGNVNSFGPRACYDEGKRFSEAAAYVFIHKYQIDARIVRIFNTYGPKMQKNDGRVISNFINFALNDLTILIDGDGSQTRSFCFVSDMIEGLSRAMFFNSTKGEVFNLGNPDEYSINDLAKKIIQMTQSSSKIKYTGKFRPDDPMRRQPDISKAKKILGWQPAVSLDEGLKKTIEYYRYL